MAIIVGLVAVVLAILLTAIFNVLWDLLKVIWLLTVLLLDFLAWMGSAAWYAVLRWRSARR